MFILMRYRCPSPPPKWLATILKNRIESKKCLPDEDTLAFVLETWFGESRFPNLCDRARRICTLWRERLIDIVRILNNCIGGEIQCFVHAVSEKHCISPPTYYYHCIGGEIHCFVHTISDAFVCGFAANPHTNVTRQYSNVKVPGS